MASEAASGCCKLVRTGPIERLANYKPVVGPDEGDTS
jgi:hypothetical protein